MHVIKLAFFMVTDCFAFLRAIEGKKFCKESQQTLYSRAPTTYS